MAQYRYKELKSCVNGEQIYWEFDGVDFLYTNLLTRSGYGLYQKDISLVERSKNSSPCCCSVRNDVDSVLVGDLNGLSLPAIRDNVKRFSFEFSLSEMQTMTTNDGKVIVQNASDTEADGSMIEYWKESFGREPDFRCPSCGKIVSRAKLDGAHVHKYRGSKLYIVPICQSCNRSKVDRWFKVNEEDLIPAP